MKPIEIYSGLDRLPAEYLARNQSEPERIAKIKAEAQARRAAKNARRAQRMLGKPFQVDLRKVKADGEV